MKFKLIYFLILPFLFSCQGEERIRKVPNSNIPSAQINTSLILLGTIQDAGSPHIACKKECCKDLFENPDQNRQVISLGLYDALTNKKYLFEATPDISRQVKKLKSFGVDSQNELPDGIFLTHAHIGHYSGLMYLGKEATNAKHLEVFAMPRMKSYLEENGPWSQLVNNDNIYFNELHPNSAVQLSSKLKVTPFLVPHRDEYSETVGYRIEGPKKKALFIPDIDKWEKWGLDILEEIKKVDYAFVDATFYSGKEINTRDIKEIPHPFVIESMELFNNLPLNIRNKIIFIHFNHTNPIINFDSEEAKKVMGAGFRIGRIHDSFEL